jgi:hypothetical protein
MSTIALFVLVMAFVCVGAGVVANVALYLKGAFKAGPFMGRRLEPVTLSREVEQDFYMGLGATGRPIDAYILRVIKVFICSVLLASLFVALLIYAAPR